ncbi:hypothetical protein [Spirosoma endbachense]|uniref:hypothetical protein n=1 Tax=Spirosoma endbachense TaxID=2666025 RepID=UPI001E5E4D94|nr:hypothetical protein [Spirosoma endbachense]
MTRKEHIKQLDKQEATSISRRSFLSNTAMAGTGLMLSPLLLSASADQPKNNNNQGANKLHEKDITMKKRNLGTLEVAALGAGCMSISAVRQQTEHWASKQFAQRMKMELRSLTPPKSTDPIQMKI